jgi:hypothetical protein
LKTLYEDKQEETMLGRVSHPVFGLGFALAEHISGSGKPASIVVLDFNTTVERTVLDSFLSASAASLPEAAKAKPKRKPRAKKTELEPISDSLLVPEIDDNHRLDFTTGFESYTETA